MLFHWRKRQRFPGCASHPSGPSTNEAAERLPPQWETWHRSAQKVTRSWNEWSAAAGRDRSRLFGCYLGALFEEEQAAAELERTVKRGTSTPEVADLVASVASSDRFSQLDDGAVPTALARRRQIGLG